MSPRENPPKDEGARDKGAKARTEAAEAKAAEGQEEAAEKAEASEAAEKKEKKPARRRSAETATKEAKKPAPRTEDGAVVVRASSKYVRTAPRKARLVMEHIRGKQIEEARAILAYATRSAAREITKLLESAVANAENNHELGADELRVRRAYVDEGPTIKRYRPRALGRATRINKRTSHMTIELTTERN